MAQGRVWDGVEFKPTEAGTPQGGPLSPLLANLLLDDLDKELERRGHCFCRYADDCAPRRCGKDDLRSVPKHHAA
jgi:RNA-directed DNA polymerase